MGRRSRSKNDDDRDICDGRRAEGVPSRIELTSEPGRRQERLGTALAYERMAERAKRHLGLT